MRIINLTLASLKIFPLNCIKRAGDSVPQNIHVLFRLVCVLVGKQVWYME